MSAGKLLGLAALSAVLSCGVALPPSAAQAQGIGEMAPAQGQMLLEADRLIYDNDADQVTAAGNVRIDYDGRRIVAQRVVYDRASERLRAYGNVELIETDGTRTYAEEVDISDDFAEGFVNTLRVETTERTYFASESAQRRDGEVTQFNSGVYTACEPCEDNPDRAPLWQVRSRTIIWDGKARTIQFVRPRLEIFGFPIAFFPQLTVPDHTVKRKSGFLFPTIKSGDGTGFGVGVPYYHVFSPSMDLTTTVTGYVQQGFLGEAEFRQRFNSGQYTVKLAGIWQSNPAKFSGGANSINRNVTGRAMLGTQGRFQINPRWAFGWNLLVQTDKNFANTYGIEGYADYYHRSEVYLTGINGRNFFDLRAMRFQVQENTFNGRHEIQPWVAPSLDYAYTPDDPVFGGELNFNLNVQGIHRDRLGSRAAVPDPRFGPIIGRDTNIDGLAGTSGRITAEAEWQRTYIAPGGLVITPLLHARADAIGANFTDQSIAAIRNKRFNGQPVDADIRSAYYRAMATAGMEVRWPILFSTSSASHIFEPIGQIFARPDEPYANSLGIPNEDAQSLVFDASNLFERDKFSGYDRMEGGVRANLGFRYSASFGERWAANALFGQSFHLAGVNSYASPDLVNVGAYSGLETNRSDYVGQVGLSGPGRLNLALGGRFDERTFEMRRTDATLSGRAGPVNASVRYSFIQAQPLYGFENDRREVSVTTSAQVAEYWRVFASGTYDFESQKLVRNSIGFAYDDECFTFALTASQARDPRPNFTETTTSVGFRISLRTLGDIGTSAGF